MVWSCALTPAARRHGHDVTVGPPAGLGTVAAALAAPAVAALTLTLARTGRIDRLSDGLCRSDDFEAGKARMAEFMAHGFIGICRSRADAREGPGHG